MAEVMVVENAPIMDVSKMSTTDIIIRAFAGDKQCVGAFAGLFEGQRTKIREIAKTTLQTAQTVTGIETEYPLLPTESDELSARVRKKGVQVLGGKNSKAYENMELRKKVYRDIYGEVKRNFGLISETGTQLSYKKLKRKHLSKAFGVVDAYTPGFLLSEEIEEANEVGELLD